MEPILTIDNLNSFGGNMLRQGDKSQLKYRLRDVGNKNLSISSKPCQVKMYGRNYTTVVYETTTTVSTENTVSFTIDKVLPKGTFYLEFTVGSYIFPTDHREFFEITPSGKGIEANVIEIVGKDVLIREVKSQVDAELQPLVTSLESAQQAETQRASAESGRVSAEEQREIDHANRSAELAGKADKVVIKNLIDNGDVESTLTIDTASYIGITDEGALVDRGHYYSLDNAIDMTNEHIYYVNANFTQGAVRERIYLRYEDASVHDNGASMNLVSQLSTTIKAKYTKKANLKLYSNVGTYTKDYVMMVDLTQTFGVGNEPTKEEMDELIKVTGYIDGEYALNNKEMLVHLMKGIGEKANKKQEDWITATLLNGTTGTVQYRKNEFGTVEIRGSVSILNSGLQAFILPVGYRPSSTFSNAVTTRNSNNVYRYMLGSSGSSFFNVANTEVDLTGISFGAGG